jgi:RNA polymerase sigma factor (sigma-70 family)
MGDASDRMRVSAWVREHGPSLQRFLRARVRDEHAAADLVQEVFYRAWRKRLQYEPQSKDRAYLFAIADRLACDHLRRPHRMAVFAELEEPAECGDPAGGLLEAENAALVREELSRLSDAQQRTLLLRFFAGMSFQEIADALGCPLGTVLSHCRRGLERLREALAGELA